MIIFTLLAAVLVAAALVLVLRPLLRARKGAETTAGSTNRDIYRDQLAELERDLRMGTLDGAQYEAARAEVQRRVLDEVGADGVPASHSGAGGTRTALVIGVAIPVIAALLYWHLGEPQGIVAAKRASTDTVRATPAEFQAMTQQLAERMAANPDDPTGWLMLGRAYKVLARFPEAVEALSQANRRRPGNVEILVEYAEALAQAAGGKFGAQSARLLDQALAVAPDDPKALTLAGGAAFEAGEYGKAIRYWERLAKQVPPDSELGRALAGGLARARNLDRGGASGRADAGDDAQPPATAAGERAVQGEVRLSAALKNHAAPDDTVFIFARAADGPRMPLAVIRRQVKDLPADFRLDDSMAMKPELRLSAFARVVVTARVSRSGNAVAQSGDLLGESAPVAPGAGRVSVVIDQVTP
jgi:cytochrome c-type biogenesis protein CcmH